MDLVQRFFGNEKKPSATSDAYPYLAEPSLETTTSLRGVLPHNPASPPSQGALGTHILTPASATHTRTYSSSLLLPPQQYHNNNIYNNMNMSSNTQQTISAASPPHHTGGGGGEDQTRRKTRRPFYPNDAINLTAKGVEFSGTTSLDADAERRFLETGQTAARNFVEAMKRLEGAMEGLLVALDGSKSALNDLVAVAGQTSLSIISNKGRGGVVAVRGYPQLQQQDQLANSQSGHPAGNLSVNSSPPQSVDDHPSVQGYRQLQSLAREYEECVRVAKKTLLPLYKRQIDELCTRPIASVKEQLETVENLRDHRRRAAAEANSIIGKLREEGALVMGEDGKSYALSWSATKASSPSAGGGIRLRTSPSSSANAHTTTASSPAPLFLAGGSGEVALKTSTTNVASSTTVATTEDLQKLEDAMETLTNVHLRHNDSLRALRETELYSTAAAAQSLLFTTANALGQLSMKLNATLNTSLPRRSQVLLPDLAAEMGVFTSPPQRSSPPAQEGDEKAAEHPPSGVGVGGGIGSSEGTGQQKRSPVTPPRGPQQASTTIRGGVYPTTHL